MVNTMMSEYMIGIAPYTRSFLQFYIFLFLFLS